MLSATTHRRKREHIRLEVQNIHSHGFRGAKATDDGYVTQQRGDEWICAAMRAKQLTDITAHATEQLAEAEARKRMDE